MKRVPLIISIILLSIGISTTSFAHKKVLIIPVEINSISFSCERDEIQKLLSDTEDYYGALNGKYPSEFFLAPTIKLTSARYTSQTASMAALEAYRLCSRQIDMSLYENDFGIIFSGSNIWPHEGQIKGTALKYFASSEIFEDQSLPLGPFCHEYGHIIGLKDLYDTDSAQSGGESIALWGSLSIMDKGDRNDSGRTPCALSAIERHLLGLTAVDTLTTGQYHLEPATRGGKYYLLPTDKVDEYFLLECRAQEGRDAFIGGEGLLVYHIDRSSNKAGYSTYYDKILSAQQRWEYNQVNCRIDHQCAMLLEAFPGASEVSEVFFPYRENQSLSSESTPALRFWSGAGSKYAIRGIRRTGEGDIEFEVIEPVRMVSTAAYQNAALLNWTVDESLLGDLDSYELFIEGENQQEEQLSGKADSDGNITVYLDNLQDNTNYTAELLIHVKDDDYSLTSKFSTLIIDERNTIPFIFLSNITKNPDGSVPKGTSIPLYVFNSHNAKNVSWTYNGATISADSKGSYTLTESGILRAELLFDDSSVDVICKEFTVR